MVGGRIENRGRLDWCKGRAIEDGVEKQPEGAPRLSTMLDAEAMHDDTPVPHDDLEARGRSLEPALPDNQPASQKRALRISSDDR